MGRCKGHEFAATGTVAGSERKPKEGRGAVTRGVLGKGSGEGGEGFCVEGDGRGCRAMRRAWSAPQVTMRGQMMFREKDMAKE